MWLNKKAKILTGIIINIYLPWNFGKDIILKVKMKVINSVYELVIIAILMNMKTLDIVFSKDALLFKITANYLMSLATLLSDKM